MESCICGRLVRVEDLQDGQAVQFRYPSLCGGRELRRVRVECVVRLGEDQIELNGWDLERNSARTFNGQLITDLEICRTEDTRSVIWLHDGEQEAVCVEDVPWLEAELIAENGNRLMALLGDDSRRLVVVDENAVDVFAELAAQFRASSAVAQ